LLPVLFFLLIISTILVLKIIIIPIFTLVLILTLVVDMYFILRLLDLLLVRRFVLLVLGNLVVLLLDIHVLTRRILIDVMNSELSLRSVIFVVRRNPNLLEAGRMDGRFDVETTRGEVRLENDIRGVCRLLEISSSLVGLHRKEES
jgi:hypothetical protein